MQKSEYAELIGALQQTPQEGLRALIATFGGMVKKISYAVLCGHAQDAEEAIADTFIKLWKNAAKLPVDAKLQTYIAYTARTVAIDRYRKLKREGVFLPLSEIEPDDADFARIIESTLAENVLAQQILQLPPPDGEIFLRRYYYCETVTEIAAHYQIPEATVRTKLTRARQKLRTKLAKEEIA